MKLFDIILENISGDWGNESPQSTSDVEVKCLRSADIVPIYQFDYSGIPFRYVSQKSMEARILHEGDIVIEKSGGTNNCSTGRPIYISGELLENNEPLLCSNFCSAIRLKKDWNPRYVYYYLRLIHKEGLFFNFEGKTSGIHNLDMDAAFKAIDIPEISYPEQEQVAKILSSLDRKIALNRKINAELEQMAKELYDYWFVQFDFPNAEGKPYKSSGGKMVYNPQLKRDIPEGWEVGNIFSVSELITGGTPSKKISEYWENGTIPFFGPTDFDGSLYQIGTKDKITHLGLEHSAANLIAPNCIIITARGSIGKVVVTGVEMAMNQSCFAFSPINDTYPFLYFLTKQLIQHLLVKGSGSTFNSIVTVDIENSIMSLGNAHFRQLFSNKIKPIFNKLRLNTDEIQQLSSLRDQLLPLLMNGQVKIN